MSDELTDTTDLWWHLIEIHGISASNLHGNPEMMHGALHGAYGCVALPGKDHEHGEVAP